MKQLLEFHTGETTCKAETGVCPFVYTMHFGTKWACHLYNDVDLRENSEGWLARHERCLKDFQGAEEAKEWKSKT